MIPPPPPSPRSRFSAMQASLRGSRDNPGIIIDMILGLGEDAGAPFSRGRGGGGKRQIKNHSPQETLPSREVLGCPGSAWAAPQLVSVFNSPSASPVWLYIVFGRLLAAAWTLPLLYEERGKRFIPYLNRHDRQGKQHSESEATSFSPDRSKPAAQYFSQKGGKFVLL